MNKLRVGLGVALVLAGAAGSPLRNLAAQAQPSTEPPIEVTQVPHPSTPVRWGRAAAELEAPKDAVMRVIEDYAGYKDFLPHFRASRVISQRNHAALVYFEAQIAMFTFWSEMRIQPLANTGDTETIAGKMIRGNARFMEARWDVEPVDPQHTKVALQLILVPKVPLPSGFVSDENAKAAGRAIGGLRRILQTPEAAQ